MKDEQAMNNGLDENTTPGMDPERRRFLKTVACMGAGLAAGMEAGAQPSSGPSRNPGNEAAHPMDPLPMTNTGADQIPRKPFGRTGVNVSVLGMGGHHLGDPASVEDAIKMVQTAVDAGPVAS